ncbi:MAG: hypothetical protein FJ030_19570, partial [Chloroflexi bacterium]|nr:hypothetical protein [Chloroflexota bacterium]
MKRKAVVATLSIIVLLAIGLAAYSSTLDLNFFWEDPFDIGQVDTLSYSQLLLAPNSNSYYRPLALILLKLMKGAGQMYAPWPYHLFNVGFHLGAALLLYGGCSHWLGDRASAFSAALLFVLYPIGYEAPARASSMHSLYVSLTVIALWGYSAGRAGRKVWPYALAMLSCIAAPLLHENGIVPPLLILILEIHLFWQRKVSRFSPAALLFFIPAIAFIAVWLSIPKPTGPPQFGLHPREALYLSQGLSFPIARLISQTGGWGLPAEWQAGLAFILSLITLFALYGRAGTPQLLLALFWWGAAISLAWLARPIEYLIVSPRVMYFPSFAAALAWGGVLRGGEAGWEKIRRAVGGVVVALVAVQSWFTLGASVNLYRAGSALMDQIVAAGQGGGRQ